MKRELLACVATVLLLAGPAFAAEQATNVVAPETMKEQTTPPAKVEKTIGKAEAVKSEQKEKLDAKAKHHLGKAAKESPVAKDAESVKESPEAETTK